MILYFIVVLYGGRLVYAFCTPIVRLLYAYYGGRYYGGHSFYLWGTPLLIDSRASARNCSFPIRNSLPPRIFISRFSIAVAS